MTGNRNVRFIVLLEVVLFSAFLWLGWSQASETDSSARADAAQPAASLTEMQNPLPMSAEVLELGKQIFNRNCTPCHGTRGKGDGPAAKFLGKQLPDFTSPQTAQKADGELFQVITQGRPPMPAFGKILSEKERWAVIHYVKSLSGKQ